jgi:hypothetical protein
MHKENTIEKSLNWDAHYVGIKATRERQQNSITLEELVDEVMPLLYRFAPITIEDQIPVFTEWVANALKENMELPRSHYFIPRLK